MVAMIRVLERIRQQIFLPLLLLSCFAFLYNMRNAEHRMSMVNSKTFLLEHCSCNRILEKIVFVLLLCSVRSKTKTIVFSSLTPPVAGMLSGGDRTRRLLASLSTASSSAHKARKYFDGIKENLRLVRSHYGATISLYFIHLS